MYIQHKFTSLNQYINIERSNKFQAAKVKRDETNVAYYSLLGSKPIKIPCKLHFKWHIPNKRSDLDNVAYAKKYILDGMVKAGILPNDNLNNIVYFIDEYVPSNKWAVEIEVIE